MAYWGWKSRQRRCGRRWAGSDDQIFRHYGMDGGLWRILEGRLRPFGWRWRLTRCSLHESLCLFLLLLPFLLWSMPVLWASNIHWYLFGSPSQKLMVDLELMSTLYASTWGRCAHPLLENDLRKSCVHISCWLVWFVLLRSPGVQIEHDLSPGRRGLTSVRWRPERLEGSWEPCCHRINGQGDEFVNKLDFEIHKIEYCVVGH